MGCCAIPSWKHLVQSGSLDRLEWPAPAAPVSASGAGATLFRNGTFLLAEGRTAGEAVNAVLVLGTKIVDVGDETRIRRDAAFPFDVVDLDNTTLAPGFVEAHAHIVAAPQTVYCLDVGVGNCQTFKDVKSLIQDQIDKTPLPDDRATPPWLFFDNFDPSLLEFDRIVGFPQLGFDEFDPLRGQDHVCIFVQNASGHIAYANRAAFTAAGVKARQHPGGGGSYGTSSDGRLNGIMFEPPSFGPFLDFAPKPLLEREAIPAMLKFLHQAQCKGVTTLADPAVGLGGSLKGELEIYNLLASYPDAKTAIVGSLDATSIYHVLGQPIPSDPPPELKMPATPGDTGSYKNLTVPAVKIWTDGSTQGYTAWVSEAYCPPVTPKGLGDTGKPDWKKHQLERLLKQAKAANWSVLLHANGDEAIGLALTALQEVYGADSPSFRNRIEHCSLATPDQYETMAQLGVTPTYLNNHIYVWGDTFYDNILGSDRADRLDATADAALNKLIFSFHCDYSVSMPDPLRYMQTAVMRQTKGTQRVLGPAQRITPMEALKAVTIYPARQLGVADRIGTIAVGKDADFVQLECNPLEVAGDAIASIAVRATWLKGRHIAAASPAGAAASGV